MKSSGDADQAPAFAELLRMHRRSAGLSQEELAERAGLSAKAIGALERGRRRAPYRDTVAVLGRALGLDGAALSALESTAARARQRPSNEGVTPVVVGPRDNLPAQLTSFVGRQRELEDIARLLQRYRLVTVTGSGGFGKTRLALESAFRSKGAYEDGVWFVELASVSDPPSVVAKIAAAVGVKHAEHDPVENLATQFSNRNLLLVLDNCEHVLSQLVGAVGAILRGCPRVHVMTTSRERLALYGEVTYRVPSLSVPPVGAPVTAADARAHSAVQLFVDRAQMADPRFVFSDAQAPAVADICRKLEGIPLAVEIAAAQLPSFGLLNLRRKLDDRLNPLTNAFVDSPARQRTLQTVLEWSYDLLDVSERALFRRASIFRGACSAEAALAVCGGANVGPSEISELFTSLVDKSLLTLHEGEDGLRFSFLESAREFALEKLDESGEGAEISDRLIEWAAAFADEIRYSEGRVDNDKWYTRAVAEFDSAYAGLVAALDGERNILAAGRIFGGLRVCWLNVGRDEAVRIATLIVSQLDSQQHPGVAAALHLGLSNVLVGVERVDALRAGCDLLTRTDDAAGLTRCYFGLSWAYVLVGNLSEASAALDNARKFAAVAGMNNPHVRTQALWIEGVILLNGGEEASRVREVLRSAAQLAIASNDSIMETLIGIAYAETYFCSGDVLQALSLFEELVDDQPSYPEQHAYLQLSVAGCLLFLGDIEAAQAAARLVLRGAAGMETQAIWAIRRLAHVKSLRGEATAAARLVGCIDRRIASVGLYLDRFEQVCNDALMAHLRTNLSSDELRVHQDEGAKMSLHEAEVIALAT